MIFTSISNQYGQLNQDAHRRRLRMLQMQRKYAQPKAKLVKPNTKLYGVDQFARSRYQRQGSKSGIAILNEKVSEQTQQYLRNSSYSNNPYPNFDYGYIPAHNRRLGQSRYSTSSNKYAKPSRRPQYYMKSDKIVENQSRFDRSKSSENLKKQINLYQDAVTFLNINKPINQKYEYQPLGGRQSTYQKVCLNPILAQSLNYQSSRDNYSPGLSNYNTSKFGNQVVYDLKNNEIGKLYNQNIDQIRTSSSYNSPFEMVKPTYQKANQTPHIKFQFQQNPQRISSTYISNRMPQINMPQRSVKTSSQNSISKQQQKTFEMNTLKQNTQSQIDTSFKYEQIKQKKSSFNYAAIVIGFVIFLAVLLLILQLIH